MKKTLFILFFIRLSSFVYSQNISFSTLIDLQKNNSSSFEKLAQKQGYNYVSTDVNSDFTVISYSYYNLKEIEKRKHLYYYTWKIKVNSILYTTSDRFEINSLQAEIIKLGYKPCNAPKTKQQYPLCYRKGKMIVRFSEFISLAKKNSDDRLFSIDISPRELEEN